MNPVRPNALGNMLRDRRRSVPNRSAADVAATIKSTRTGKAVSQPSYSDWENGVVAPSEEWFDDLAAFLGISRRAFLLLRFGEEEDAEVVELRQRVTELDEELRLIRRDRPPEPPASS